MYRDILRYRVGSPAMTARALCALPLVGLLLGLGGCGSDDGDSGVDADDPSGTTRGYVVSGFGYVFPEHDQAPCPGGFTKGPIEMQIEDGFVLPDDCNDPESVSDPGFKTLDGPGRAAAFDLDGLASTLDSPGTGECPHEDFVGPSGEAGIDYQYWRAVGCIAGFQKGEIADSVTGEAVVNGSMTILVNIEGIDDEMNDDDVTVQVFGSTDIPAIGADGNMLPFATLSIHEDPQYHGGVGKGKIVDGVLIAGPMDINLRLNIQIVEGNQSMRDGFVRFELQPDGTIKGQMFGYQPIAEAYNIFGIQAGVAGASALSYTCTGLWEALRSNADGHPDPDTGECSTISVAYQFEGVPAFVAK